MACKVIIPKRVERSLIKLPLHIRVKFNLWIEQLVTDGLRATRQIKSFHDEPLKGKRAGQRSIRLNRAYRAIYKELESGKLELIEVIEVNKHEY